MIYKDIVNEQNEIKIHLDDFSTIIGAFKDLLSEYNKNINIVWKNISENGSYSPNSLKQSSDSKKNFNELFSSYNFGFINCMSKLYKLKNISDNKETSLNFNKFVEIFDDFLIVLESYLDSKKNSNLIPNLVFNLSNVINSYESIINEIEIVSKYDVLLESQSYTNDEILELQFYNGVSTEKEMILVMSSISDLYSRGLSLFDRDIKDYPLEIIKIETGTFYEKVKGDPLIVGIIGIAFGFVLNVAYDIHKDNSDSKVLDNLSKTLDIRGKMIEQNLDPSTMDEEIKIYEGILLTKSKKMSKLSSKVRINDEILKLEPKHELRFIDDRNKFIKTLSLPILDIPVEGLTKYENA